MRANEASNQRGKYSDKNSTILAARLKQVLVRREYGDIND